MKLLRKATLTFVLALFAVGVFAQQFGHVNATLVLAMTPEYTQAMAELAKLDTTYSVELEKLEVEIRKKYDEFQNDSLAPDLVKQVKVQEIQEMEYRYQEFQKGIQTDMQTKQQQLITPISTKIIEAINAIAKEKNLIYVFDVSQGNPIYASEESVDLVPLLFEKFGIEYDPNAMGMPGAGMAR